MNEEDLISFRIRKLREHLKLGRGAFEKKTGIPSKTIENIEQGKQKAYAWHIAAIANEWPDYTIWLLTGTAKPGTGQTSPEIEEKRQNLGQTGRAA